MAGKKAPSGKPDAEGGKAWLRKRTKPRPFLHALADGNNPRNPGRPVLVATGEDVASRSAGRPLRPETSVSLGAG